MTILGLLHIVLGGVHARRQCSLLSFKEDWVGRLFRREWFDSFLGAASVLDLLQHLDQAVDGVVMAGFGEHGRVADFAPPTRRPAEDRDRPAA